MRDGCWPGSGRGAARLIATLLAVLGLAGLLTAATPALPAAAATGSELRITLTRLSPAVLHPDSTIVVEGRVTNVSDRPLVRLQAMIWRDLTPITDRSGLEAANASASTDPVGARMYQRPPWYADLYTADKPELAPGASHSFRLSAKAADFFGTANPTAGVYLAGVQVRENGAATVGRVRTYLPLVSAPQPHTGLQPGQTVIGTSTLVELAATPSMIRPGLFSTDELAAEIAPGGRLDELLTAAEQPDAAFAVDPDLIVALRSMRSGYQVLGADGKRRPGTGRADAGHWLDRFTALRSGHDGYQLLYGRADLTSLVHAGRLDIVRAGRRAARDVAGLSGLPLLVIPDGGVADQATLEAAQQLGARAVVLADTTVYGLGPLVSAGGSPTILSYDIEAATGPGPDPRRTEVQLRQASLADTFIDSISGRPADELGRLRLVTDAAQAGGETAASTAPWLQPRPLGLLLSGTPQTLRGRPSYPLSARQHELTLRQLDRIGAEQHDLTVYRDALAKPAAAAALVDQALPRVASVAWRGHHRAMAGYLADQLMLLTGSDGSPVSVGELVDGTAVRVESNPQVTLTGASAQIPVTIVNTLDVALKLGLVAESPNRSRLTLRDIPAATLGTIAAGARVPAQVKTHADANGTMPIRLWLATTGGQPVGHPLTVRVNATQAGLVGWIIALAAGIVLLGTVVLRIRQVAHERSDGEAAAGPAGPAPTNAEPGPHRSADAGPNARPDAGPEPAADADPAPGTDPSRSGVPRG